MGREPGNDAGRIALVAALLLAALACALGAVLLTSPEGRHLSATGGGGLLVSLGVLALFSIGTLLLIAAGLLIVSIGAGRLEDRQTPVALVVLAFAIGMGLPWVLVFTA